MSKHERQTNNRRAHCDVPIHACVLPQTNLHQRRCIVTESQLPVVRQIVASSSFVFETHLR